MLATLRNKYNKKQLATKYALRKFLSRYKKDKVLQQNWIESRIAEFDYHDEVGDIDLKL